MQQQITISGYHWPDIFDLPCVESIHKSYIAIDEKPWYKQFENKKHKKQRK